LATSSTKSENTVQTGKEKNGFQRGLVENNRGSSGGERYDETPDSLAAPPAPGKISRIVGSGTRGSSAFKGKKRVENKWDSGLAEHHSRPWPKRHFCHLYTDKGIRKRQGLLL